jgi:Sulfotransferase family
MPETDQFLVVTGAMRSGTTLMGELLYSRYNNISRHPRLSFANDNILRLRELREHLELSKKVRLEDLDTSAASVPGPISPADLEQALRLEGIVSENKTPAALLKETLVGEILQVAPLKETPQVIGLKNTLFVEEHVLVDLAFKDVFTVVMFRDPRDVLASNFIRQKKKPGIKEKKAFANALVMTALIMNVLAFCEMLGSKRKILSLTYEELITDTRPWIEKILKETKLDADSYDWSIFEGGKIMSNTSYAGGGPDAVVANSGISKLSVGKYTEVLSAPQVEFIEWILWPVFKKYGYAATYFKEQEPVSAASKELLEILKQQSKQLGYSLDYLPGSEFYQKGC